MYNMLSDSDRIVSDRGMPEAEQFAYIWYYKKNKNCFSFSSL